MRSFASRLLLITVILVLQLSPFATAAGEQAVIAPLAERSLLLDLEQAGDRLIAVGERGHILISEDSGNSWTQVETPTRTTLTGLFFIDGKNGWAVGHDQVILKTGDGGSSWRLVYQDIEADSPLFDIYFLDASHGYAVGAYGQFLETFDGGENWSGRWISEDDFHLNQIIPLGDKLFIAAEAGQAYRSGSQGRDWTILMPGYEGSFFGILALADNSLLLFGLRGNMFRSDDLGDSWTRVATGTEASLTNGLVLSDGSVVVTGLAGAKLISSDNGRTFTLDQDPQRKGFSALRQTRDGKLVGVGDFGVLQISVDAANQGKGVTP